MYNSSPNDLPESRIYINPMFQDYKSSVDNSPSPSYVRVLSLPALLTNCPSSSKVGVVLAVCIVERA